MAKATLPVNFKDDILNAGMDGKRKFTITQNTDGTYSIEDVTEYDQIGSNFGSAQINATNTAVNASADASKIIDDLATVAANTQKGYMAGALALKEVNQSLIQAPVTLVANSTRITLEDATCYYSSTEKRIYIVAKFTAKVSATAPILAVNNYNDRRSATPLTGACITSGYYGCIPCWTRNNGSNISISAALIDGKAYTISGFIEVNVVM